MKVSVKLACHLILIISLFTGRISTNFIGENYPETKYVDVYYSAREIPSDFILFGHIVSSTTNSLFVSVEDLKNALIEEAKRSRRDNHHWN